MKTLNRNKPFGTICGGNTAAAFHQDGAYFDHAGNEVNLSAPKNPAPAPAPTVSTGNTVVGTQTDADLAAASVAAALAERRSVLLMQAFPLLERAQGEVIEELEDHDADLLKVMLEVEGVGKKRKAVLEALGEALVKKSEQEAKDAAANGQQPAGADQVNTQLNA